MSESQDIKIEVSKNRLHVNNSNLDIDSLTPDYLYTVLNLARTAILNGIDEFYEEIKLANPDAQVSKAPVWVVRLGTNSKRKRILSEEGQNNNTNIHTHVSELNKKYHEFWDVINNTGFSAEVRSSLVAIGIGGIWLMLKNADKDNAIKEYFTDNYPEYITCSVMPDLEEGIAPVSIVDRNNQTHEFVVPSAAVKRLTPPRINYDNELNGQFDALIGMGLLACRNLDDNITENVFQSEFPTVNGPKKLFLPKNILARR